MIIYFVKYKISDQRLSLLTFTSPHLAAIHLRLTTHNQNITVAAMQTHEGTSAVLHVGCDAVAVLEPAKHALNQIALFVGFSVVDGRGFAVLAPRNAGDDVQIG
ncbi:MAG: hypothetical protein ACJAVR_002440 [Paracoccaceae bacterium]